MKKLLTLVIFFSLTFTLVSQTRPTNKIKKAFEAQYPQAVDANWTPTSKSFSGAERVLEWRVMYKLDGILHASFYTNKAVWEVTKSKIDQSELPDAVKKAVKADYFQFEIVIAATFEDPENKGYEVWLDDGKEGFDIQYSPEGKVLLRTLTSNGYQPIDNNGNFINK